MPRSQLKKTGPLNALRGRLPTVPGCGLQKPPETRGVQARASLGAPRPSGPAICCGGDVVYAVLVSIDRAVRFSVPSPDKIENGAPLCHVKIDDVVHPDTNWLTKLFDGAHACPLPNGNP